jgi:hypothetical protein
VQPATAAWNANVHRRTFLSLLVLSVVSPWFAAALLEISCVINTRKHRVHLLSNGHDDATNKQQVYTQVQRQFLHSPLPFSSPSSPSVGRDALGLEPEPEGVAVGRARDDAVVAVVRVGLHAMIE